MKQNKSTNTIQQHNKKHGSSIMAAHSWQHIFSQQQSNTNNNSNKKQQRRNSPFIRTILKTNKILLIPAGIYQSAITIYIPTNLTRHTALETQTDVSFITLTDTILPYNLSSNRDKRRVCAAHYRHQTSL